MPRDKAIADYSEGELEGVETDEIKQLRCDRCDYTWEPTKHPSEYSRLSCPNDDCGHQSQAKITLELKENDEPVPSPEPTETFTADEPDDTDDGEIAIDFADALGAGSDFTRLSPGEFIEWFFEEDLEEVTVKSTSILKKKCDVGNRLPTQSQMEWILSELNTEVANTVQIEWIAESYWNSAREYISQHLGMDPVELDRYVIENDSDWVKLDKANTGQRQERSDNVLRMGGGQQARGDGGSSTAVFGQSSDPAPQGGAPQQGGTAQQGNNELLVETVNTMIENQQRLAERIEKVGQSTQQQQPQQPDFNEYMEQVSRMKTMFDEFSDDDGSMSDAQIEKLANAIESNQQRMRQIEKELTNSDGDDSPVVTGGGIEAVIPVLAQRDDVNPDVITDLASAVGGVESDPEVKKKEIEKEVEMAKLDKEGEKYQRIFEGVEDVVETAAESSGLTQIADALMGGGDDEEAPERPPEAQPAHARQQAEIQTAEPVEGPPSRRRRQSEDDQ